jgi:hypothetical protein
MKKILFTAQQLNRFLLLGENNNYVIDKQYPLIRAFKRQNYLAIFCTLRIKKKTTTTKLGNYPTDSIEKIYAKFSVAKKIADAGNNPNFIFRNNSITSVLEDFNVNDFSFNDLLKIFFIKKKNSGKYKADFSNTLKKNLEDNFFNPINKFNRDYLASKINELIKNDKKGTANNLLNYFSTLCNFGVKQENFSLKDDVIRLYNQTNDIKKKVSLSLKPSINIDKQRVKRKVGKLSKENLILVEKKINQLLK